MKTASHKKIRNYAIQVLLVALAGYLFFHLVDGGRGLRANSELSKQREILAQQKAELDAQNEKLNNRVMRLRPGSLDPDMLEESAKNMMGYIGSNERVIIIEQK